MAPNEPKEDRSNEIHKNTIKAYKKIYKKGMLTAIDLLTELLMRIEYDRRRFNYEVEFIPISILPVRWIGTTIVS